MNRSDRLLQSGLTSSSQVAHKEIRRLSQLATLAGAGLMAVSSILVAWIFTMRSATDQLEDELLDCRIEVQRALSDINRDVAMLLAHDTSEALIDRMKDQPAWINQLRETSLHCSQLSRQHALRQHSKNLHLYVREISDWYRRALTWRRRSIELDKASTTGFRQVQQLLQQLKTQVEKRSGVARLDAVLKLRRELEDDPHPGTLSVLASDLMKLSRSSNLKNDLTELQLMVTRLEKENDLDKISDLGKNRVEPRLHRIRTAVEGTSLQPLVDEISATLFSEFRSTTDQPLGVYDLQVMLMTYNLQKIPLDDRATRCIAILDRQRANLDLVGARAADEFSNQFLATVGTVWCVIVIAALTCSIIFWKLTKHVSSHVTGQVKKLDSSASALREEKSALTRTKQQLQHELANHKRTQIEREKLFSDLATASRKAGMAEVANGVLHNVGNILNSINVSTDVLSKKLRGSRSKSLQQVSDMLDSHQHALGEFFESDPRGVKLPAYLRLTTRAIADENLALQSEVTGLRKNVDHVKKIISMQQSMAKVSSAEEPVLLADLIADAITIDAASQSAAHVSLRTQLAPVPEIMTDKHQVMQILVNLIKNAKEAAADASEGLITVSLQEQADGGQEIRVSDNGVGISPENIHKMFTHGFTTKKDGHGFGLHSGSLTAKSLGGCLSVASEGTGLGATFTLTLPRRQDQESATDKNPIVLRNASPERPASLPAADSQPCIQNA